MQNGPRRTLASLSPALLIAALGAACSGVAPPEPGASGSSSGGATVEGHGGVDGTSTAGEGGGAGAGTGGAVAGTGGTGPSGAADAGAPGPDARPTTAGTSGASGTGSASSLHFVVYGDTRGDLATHQSVVDAYAKLDPQLVLHSGDLWDGYTPAEFKTVLTKNPNIAALLDSNLFLVSRGNHETAADMRAFQPTLVRNGQELYSATVGPAFFVSLGMDPASAVSFLQQELSSPAAQAATWRFVFSHYPIYSGGPHGGHGNAAIESLCDQYGVAIYFDGHDHLYERSQQMHGQQIADRGDALTVAKGTVYIVTGGGGAGLYTGQPIPSTHLQRTTYNFVDVAATSTALTVNARTPDGKAFDSFTIGR
jgi:hypothetical protein